MEPTKQSVQNPWSIVMDRSDSIAVRANPARLRDLLYLVKKNGILQLPQYGLGIFEQQPDALGLRTPKWPGQATQTPRPCLAVLKCRLDDDPHIHGNSSTVKPPSLTNTPRFCPLPISARRGSQIHCQILGRPLPIPGRRPRRDR